MPVKLKSQPMRYDRRASEALMDALMPGGFAESLCEYASSGLYPLDLQLRGHEGKTEQHATLYVGLTKVLDLHYRPASGGRFKLSAHPTYTQKRWSWNAAWGTYRSERALAEDWVDVETYLDTVIPNVKPAHLKERHTQAAVIANQAFTTIDREVVFSFESASIRSKMNGAIAEPLLAALKADDSNPTWWTTQPKSLGGECDVLAMRDGELLAIEVKPRTASAQAIAWVPVQVRHYANLMQRWLDDHPNATEVIKGMADERARLGLTARASLELARPLRVRPVVVIERGASKVALQRMRDVSQRLDASGHNNPSLEVLELTPAGRLKPFPLA